jgi:DNA-binding NarL/FixJ family response regulator
MIRRRVLNDMPTVVPHNGDAMTQTRVLIVDEQPLFRLGLAAALGDDGEFAVVGEAATGAEAVERALSLAPDVVVCEVELPDTSGMEVARRLKVHRPDTSVVLLAAADDEEQLFEAARVGAAGYFGKRTEPAPLLAGLRRAARGESLLADSTLEHPRVASRMLSQFRHLGDDGPEIEPLLVPLSSREMEILELVAQGNTNRQIAHALYLSDQTVKNHITSILRKLAVNDRTQAVVLALRQGWIRVGHA